MRIENSVIRDNYLSSLLMPNSNTGDGIFNLSDCILSWYTLCEVNTCSCIAYYVDVHSVNTS